MFGAAQAAADVLRGIGMHPKYKGYAYTLHILTLAQQRPGFAFLSTGTLYCMAAEAFGVSPASVERSTRFAIRKTWENGNHAGIAQLFGAYDTTYTPTNREFISVLMECIACRRVQAEPPIQLAMPL